MTFYYVLIVLCSNFYDTSVMCVRKSLSHFVTLAKRKRTINYNKEKRFRISWNFEEKIMGSYLGLIFNWKNLLEKSMVQLKRPNFIVKCVIMLRYSSKFGPTKTLWKHSTSSTSKSKPSFLFRGKEENNRYPFILLSIIQPIKKAKIRIPLYPYAFILLSF